MKGLTLLNCLASPPALSLLQRISNQPNLEETNASKDSTQSRESISGQTSPISKHYNEGLELLARRDFRSKKDKTYYRDSSEELIRENKEEIEGKKMGEEDRMDLSNNSLVK